MVINRFTNGSLIALCATLIALYLKLEGLEQNQLKQQEESQFSLKKHSTFFLEIGSLYNSHRGKQFISTICESIQSISGYGRTTSSLAQHKPPNRIRPPASHSKTTKEFNYFFILFKLMTIPDNTPAFPGSSFIPISHCPPIFLFFSPGFLPFWLFFCPCLSSQILYEAHHFT